MVKKVSVRLMVPFSMRCTSCSHFIYKSTKFNARKSSTGEQYLGITIVQFSIRCSSCGNEILFRTDPKTSGYIVLSGADRNIDPWHDKAAETESVDEKLARLAKQSDRNESSHESDEEEPKSDNGERSRSADDPIFQIKKTDTGSQAVNMLAKQEDPQGTTSTSVPPSKVSKLPIPKRRKHLVKHS